MQEIVPGSPPARSSPPLPPPVGAAMPRSVAAALFIVLWLGVQVGLPLWKRFQPHQQRFGWQMYSGWRARATPTRGTEFVGVRADGERVQVNRRRYMVRYRPEIRGGYVERMTAHICRVEPSLRSVEAVRYTEVLYRRRCDPGLP